MTKRNGYQPKPRNTSRRERKKVILLMAEGENKTETFYFKGLSNSSYVIQFAPGNYTDPVNMVNALNRAFDDLGLDATAGDAAYCLIDSDVDPKKDKQIASADAKAGDGIKVIVSCPCFEIWYLCHYIKSTRQYVSNKEVIGALKKYLPEYNKSMTNMRSILKGKSEEAIKNAEELEKHCQELKLKPHSVEFQPSTEVYKILSQFLAGYNKNS